MRQYRATLSVCKRALSTSSLKGKRGARSEGLTLPCNLTRGSLAPLHANAVAKHQKQLIRRLAPGSWLLAIPYNTHMYLATHESAALLICCWKHLLVLVRHAYPVKEPRVMSYLSAF